MSLEEKLSGWTSPSSDTEKDKQDRTERMIRDAINSHAPFDNCSLKVFAKGSYANNTNVRSDSDVDIAVECTDVLYWEESEKGNHLPGKPYEGIWTPSKLRSELIAAMMANFPGQVDSSGSTAIQINSSSARVDADVVPCFSYGYYLKYGTRDGTKIFKKDGSSIVNYPDQQMENGTAKNNVTNYAYKKGVRLLKRIENAMAADGTFRELPSFFIECLAYNCPNHVYLHSTWTDYLRAILFYIWDNLQGDEPSEGRWLEANECFFLFHSEQKWTRADGREFAIAAWNYFGFK
ncbi:nucleotidyltransferase [Polynucleobacter sp. AP-Melu-500A-A1]|uniref:nucleotidyltransferase domain-containing protein n=1 Tax=Polynucleobacter sp. AP-Melu-500A-A1 TaxID=2576929 RepID=UPI001C0DFCBD|nr:nucleotidyltransferase [Polynucleobacter sp. AP-Melu-500A-A1]MBU3631165.1 nucleotidyltransferase [Polynucleobacter sp. AP-Melu-500A-A1]